MEHDDDGIESGTGRDQVRREIFAQVHRGGRRSKILFFGGQGSGSDFYNDLHLLDLDQPELRLKQLYARSANEPPFPRCSGTLTAMAVNGVKNSEVVALFSWFPRIFRGFSNSLRILCADGNDGLRVSDAAVNGSGLIWRQPVVRANPNNPGLGPCAGVARWGPPSSRWMANSFFSEGRIRRIVSTIRGRWSSAWRTISSSRRGPCFWTVTNARSASLSNPASLRRYFLIYFRWVPHFRGFQRCLEARFATSEWRTALGTHHRLGNAACTESRSFAAVVLGDRIMLRQESRLSTSGLTREVRLR